MREFKTNAKILHASISYATQTTPSELIAAPGTGSGLSIIVIGGRITAASAVTAQLKSATTNLTGAMTMAAGVPIDLAGLECAAEEALNLVLGGNVQVSGWVEYIVAKSL